MMRSAGVVHSLEAAKTVARPVEARHTTESYVLVRFAPAAASGTHPSRCGVGGSALTLRLPAAASVSEAGVALRTALAATLPWDASCVPTASEASTLLLATPPVHVAVADGWRSGARDSCDAESPVHRASCAVPLLPELIVPAATATLAEVLSVCCRAPPPHCHGDHVAPDADAELELLYAAEPRFGLAGLSRLRRAVSAVSCSPPKLSRDDHRRRRQSAPEASWMDHVRDKLTSAMPVRPQWRKSGMDDGAGGHNYATPAAATPPPLHVPRRSATLSPLEWGAQPLPASSPSCLSITGPPPLPPPAAVPAGADARTAAPPVATALHNGPTAAEVIAPSPHPPPLSVPVAGGGGLLLPSAPAGILRKDSAYVSLLSRRGSVSGLQSASSTSAAAHPPPPQRSTSSNSCLEQSMSKPPSWCYH